MAVLIVSAGAMSGFDPGSVGKYLAEFDPDFGAGRGLVRWTADKTRALRFADIADAFACWKRPSTVVPLRPDGKPNRPLTAYTITFEETPDG